MAGKVENLKIRLTVRKDKKVKDEKLLSTEKRWL